MERVWTTYAEIVQAIAESEPVHLNVNDRAMEATARHFLSDKCNMRQLTFHHFQTNDTWCRDHGAVIVARAFDSSVAPPLLAIDWRFNAWGNKAIDFDLDNAIALQMANSLELPVVAGGMVLEGGSIEVNGAGLLITTESCLLNPNRNPDFGREQIEDRLRAMLGVTEVVWLGQGLVGDKTDGHIDRVVRFIGKNTVVAAIEYDVTDPNCRPLRRNFDWLSDYRRIDGKTLNVVPLPLPEPVEIDGRRVPASYADFYIANQTVVVPVFNHASDERACDILGELFPSRRVAAVDCSDLVLSTGSIHCLTQQVPIAPHTAAPNQSGLLV